MSPNLEVSPKDFCSRAIAYVKGMFDDEPGNPGRGPAVQLSFEDSPAYQPLCDGLGVMYLVDIGDSFQYVNYRDLHASGLTLDQMHELAVRNLAAICRERLQIHPHANIFAFVAGGQFESSCMLLDDIFDRVLVPRIANGYIAAVPARDIFAVCGRDNAAGIRELQTLVSNAWPDGDHLVSNKLYVRDSGKWRTVNPPDTEFMLRPRRTRL